MLNNPPSQSHSHPQPSTSSATPSNNNGFYSKEAAIAAQQAKQSLLASENADKVARLEKERLIRIEAEKKRR